MNITFRKANTSDSSLIISLAGKIWNEHYPSIISQKQIDYMLADKYSNTAIKSGMQKGEKFFLCFCDNVPLGYASIERCQNYYYLHKFYIDVSSHRKGIGMAFFSYLLNQIDETKEIRLQVNRKNFKAVNFYFKMGFIIGNVGDFAIGGGYFMNDFVMIRKAKNGKQL